MTQRKNPVIPLDPELFEDEEETPPMPLVYIRWCDAITSKEGWDYQENYVAWAKDVYWLVETVGWLLEETREHLLIAAQRGDYQGEAEYQYGLVIKIPKTWIKLRVDLTQHI